jgi:hypothetical protein
MQVHGEMTMIAVCKMLRKVLMDIRTILETGEFERLPEHLSERMHLLDRLQESRPDRDRLQETIRMLSGLAEEERLLVRLAEEKQDALKKEMNTFRHKRKALNSYQSQNLYGVQT